MFFKQKYMLNNKNTYIKNSRKNYSRTSRYGHLSIDKILIYFLLKKTSTCIVRTLSALESKFKICTCKIAKDAFRIVLYVTTFYMQHCAVARFVLKQWFVYDCTYFVAEMYNALCYWKTVCLNCELINLNAV